MMRFSPNLPPAEPGVVASRGLTRPGKSELGAENFVQVFRGEAVGHGAALLPAPQAASRAVTRRDMPRQARMLFPWRAEKVAPESGGVS